MSTPAFVCPYCGDALEIWSGRRARVSWRVDPETGRVDAHPCAVSASCVDPDDEPVLACVNDDCGISSNNEIDTCALRDRLTCTPDHEL
jgi:hypothetical protein